MASVQCPHCQAFTTLTPLRVVGTAHVLDLNMNNKDRQSTYPLTDGEHTIVTCGACDRTFFVVDEMYSDEGLQVWPPLSRATPDNLPAGAHAAFRDASLAESVGSTIGAFMAARTALERMLRDKGMSRFSDMVPDLITTTMYGAADEVRLWANLLTHEDVDAADITPEDVAEIMEYLSTILEVIYTQPARVEQARQRRKNIGN